MKTEIRKTLINLFSKIPMYVPSGLDNLVDFIYTDIHVNADPLNWSDANVIDGFRKWIEEQSLDLNHLEKILIRRISLNVKINKIWFSIDELISDTNINVLQIKKVLLISNKLVENTKGQITTKKIYQEKSSFLRKLKDSYTGIIK